MNLDIEIADRWHLPLAVIASGALYYVSTGLDGIGALAYIAPFPILAVAFQSSFRATFLASFLAYALGTLNMVAYLGRLAPPIVVLASVVLPAFTFALAVSATRASVLHGTPLVGILVFPSIWTSYEFLLSLFSPHGTAGSLAYTQSGFLPLIQVASLTGIWGITFVVSMVPAGLAVAWHRAHQKVEAAFALLIPIAIVLVLVLSGWIRIVQQKSEWPVTVGLATCDTTVQYFRTTSDSLALPVVQAYAQRAIDLAVEGAQVVLFPEKFVGVTQRYDTTVMRIFLETARDNRVFIVAGLNDIEPRRNVNTAIVFSPLDNKILQEYDKKYLIPGLESNYRAGNNHRLFRIKNIEAGIEICKDMDFPSWSREYGRLGARIVFVPAWDFKQDEELHAQMAMMRGIENGFAVVRCAQEGLLTISDYTGRIVAEESSSSSPEVLLLGAVQPGPGKSFYSSAGDWFAWGNVLFVCLFAPSFIVYVSRRALKKFQAHS